MDRQERIRIMIVDDQAVVRSGLAALLQTFRDLELVGEAGSGEEAVRLCTRLKPDVVLMDLMMPGMGGAETIRTIRRLCSETKVMILSSARDPESVRAALCAGATGYLLKDTTPLELVKALREVAAGRSILGREVTETLIQIVTRGDRPEFDLTEREREVLSLLVAGLSNPQIAQRLLVSRSTVKFHLSSIFSKLGVSTRTEAVAMAIRCRLVDAQPTLERRWGSA
ncbi:MAG TPA: response regulator transcription factor [Symbiobacteriaceae bacterium]